MKFPSRLLLSALLFGLPTLSANTITTSTGIQIDWTEARIAASDAYGTIANRRFEEGEAAFNRALELAEAEGWTKAERAGLRGGRAQVFFQLGKFPEAMQDIEWAILHDKNISRANALRLKVAIARAMGDIRAATDALAQIQPADFVSEYQRNSSDRAGIERTKAWASFILQLEEAQNRRAWGDMLGARDSFEEARQYLDAGLDEIISHQVVLNMRRDYARVLIAMDEPQIAMEEAHQALHQSLILRGTTRRRPREQWIARGDVEVLACLIVAAQCAVATGATAIADAHYETAASLAQRLELPDDWRLVQLQRMDTWMIANDARKSEITPGAIGQIVSELRNSPQTRIRVEGLTLAGKLLFHLGDYTNAVDVLESAIDDIERVRTSASFEDRRDFLALQADNYRRLITASVRTGQYWNALFAAESLKSRQLIEMLDPGAETETRTERLESLREFQQRLPDDLAAINYANADWSETPPVAIVVTNQQVKGVELSMARLRLELAGLPVQRILEAQQREVDANRYGRSSEITLAGVIAFYREAMACKFEDIPKRVPDILSISPILHTILIDPVINLAGDRRRFLISPNGLLNYLPFDTLISRQNQFLINTHALTWTPSFITTMTLARRSPGQYERPLIAFGGAVYNPQDYAQVMAGVATLREEMRLMRAVREGLAANTRSPYFGVFGGPSNNLAGTQAEVEEIGDILPGSKILIGRQVSETNVRRLSAEGQLRNSRVVHFAVHGSSLPKMPELSCLSLSYEGHFTRDMPAERDGKLSLAEIRSLNLRADLVTLSACETGLGAIFAGEEVVGLTTAFLTAGGDRVLSSLWAVSDVSTTFFMVDFYRRHFILNQPADLAIATIKREFIRGQYRGFSHPQFWAPFNLYGGAELLKPGGS